ncbi:CoA transferase [Herbaspirillum sp. LeCh32-8]|uniref:CaiB/BaiF CoA transferase family protein n=1 Tax=Herbaspirillum sp. LeCh32-8 TaxID=2821356 RepID=UPI001AE822C4|nr:CaiB/BaiF CoA-transferase family protein [Herbaspirillum sp. LeCh32-8]MBP0597742.1 CoA transferase [Herbaspirillum sp. LeCh32-8]
MSNEQQASLPLQGIRVIEFVHMVMGPTCGLVLADLGAEVIKVEPETGDNTRRLMGSGAGYWVTYNRNKKSVAVDLKSESGMAFVKELIASADVVTENFRHGAMEKIGLDYESLKSIKPDLIYCSMKGFLPGPYEKRAALDEVVQMMSGLAYMTGPEGRPLRAGASVNDVMGGMFAAIGILSAVIERARTGKGQLIRSGLYENSAFLVGQHMAQERITGKPVAPMPNRVSAWAVYDVFSAKDDEQVFIGVVSDTQWKQFCDVFGLTELAADQSLALNNQRVKARDQFMPYLRAKFAALSKSELMALCEEAGLPYAPIKKPVELFEDEHLLKSQGLTAVSIQTGERISIPALPLEMNGRRFGTRIDVPSIGSHNEELAKEAGVTYEKNPELSEAR